MNFLLLPVCILILVIAPAWSAAIVDSEQNDKLAELHFGFETENGQQRNEDIMYNVASESGEKNTTEEVPVEYRGGYSFISADGYEYKVLYKANKNGFQPYVTAHKIHKSEK